MDASKQPAAEVSTTAPKADDSAENAKVQEMAAAVQSLRENAGPLWDKVKQTLKSANGKDGEPEQTQEENVDEVIAQLPTDVKKAFSTYAPDVQKTLLSITRKHMNESAMKRSKLEKQLADERAEKEKAQEENKKYIERDEADMKETYNQSMKMLEPIFPRLVKCNSAYDPKWTKFEWAMRFGALAQHVADRFPSLEERPNKKRCLDDYDL